MKKLLAVILAIAMILPAAALAEEKDPIIGAWYVSIDMNEYPEMKSYYGNADSVMFIYFFSEDNLIREAAIYITNGEGTQQFNTLGRWEKAEPDYLVSLLGVGENTAYIDEDDCLIIGIGNANAFDIYMRLYHIIGFDMYKDYIYVQGD